MRKLTERESEVLKALVEEYILTGKPVGSRSFVQKYSFSISPATMRNIMFDLESIGYLTHPHTSAGRIPTDVGYRYYVDVLSESYNIADMGEISYRDDFIRNEVHLDKMFMSITRMLANFSQMAGIVITPNSFFTVVKQVELIQLDSSSVLVILITRTGVVINKKVIISESVTREDLFKASNFLTTETSGYSLLSIKDDLLPQLRLKYREMDKQLSLDILELSLTALDEQSIFIEGIENILHIPEMIEKEILSGFLSLIEEKKNLITIMRNIMESDGVNTFIGKEIDPSYVQGCSLVASCYKIGKNNAGVLGVLGPTRMDYKKVIPLVDYTGKLVTNFLTQVSK